MFAQYAPAHISYPPMLDRLYYVETATKILVSNLNYAVAENDIKACLDPYYYSPIIYHSSFL